ncbi:MAG: hypothetical protein IKM43_02355 [Clostridia bacterium]|nr:hypothetical protein [Clostridia bacterium]
MKTWIPILILLLAVTGLCIWDSVHTIKVFNRMESESEYIYDALLNRPITDEEIQSRIINLNDYWTEKMDTLSVSISRKDMQPVSDYLQYLYASIINESQDDAVTYSRLLHYNLEGLREVIGIDMLNLL